MLSSLVVTGVEMASCHVEVNTYEDKNDREDVLMEDDIPQSDSEQEVSSVIGGPLPVDSVGIKLHVEEQFHTAQGSADPDSSLLVLSEKKSPTCSSEQESSLIPSHAVLRFARPVSEDCGQIIDSPAPAKCPSTSKRENSLTCPVDKESSRVLAAAEAECTKSKKYYGQVVKEDSPFGLLQGYASDDSTGNDEEPHLKNPGPKTGIPLVEVGAETLHKDSVFDLETNAQLNSKSPSKTGRDLRLLSISSGLKTVDVDSKNKDPTSICYTASPKSHQLDDANKSATVSSKVQKIDRFGRLVREGATESDSDESLYAGRHNKRRRSQSCSQSPPYAGRSKRRRSRSQSCSRSPPDRRRRRSPRRRRHQRSRSRSRSPRNRRSRSPSSRHVGEFRSGRRDKGHMAECFDFLRGKCYRGSSCRYLHHHSEKAHRSKQQNPQPPSGLKTSNTHEQTKKISIKTSGYEDDTRFNHDMPGRSNTVHKEAMSSNDAVQSFISNKVAAVCSDTNKFGWPTEVSAKPQEINVVQQEVETCENLDKAMESSYNLPLVVSSSPSGPRGVSDTVKSHCEGSQYVFSSLKDSAIKQSESDLLVAVLEDADPPPLQAGASFISDSYPNRTSATSPKKLLVSEAPQDAVDSVHNCSQTLSVSEHVNVALTKQPSMASNLTPQTARFQYQSAHSEGFPPYMLPNQNSVFSVVPNSSWATTRSLPPPPPLPLPPPPPLPLPPPPPLFPSHDHSLNRGTASLGTSLQFQQSHVPPMTKFGPQMFLRPYPAEFPSHSQSVESQHQGYPPLHERGRTLLPGCNTSNQQFRGPTQIREDQSMHLPTQGLNAANSFTQGMNYPHPITLLQASPATKMHSFHQDNLPSGEILKPSSIVNPHLQQQQCHHALSRSALNDVYTMSGKISTSPRCPPLTLDTNQPSPVPDYVVSRSSTHYNPYASTFEQPLNSRFNSDVLGQEKDTTSATKYDYPLCLNHASGDGQAASVGSMHATSAPKPAGGVGPEIPGPGRDQYDPLFDSIEPSSNSIKKFDHIPKWEPSNASDIMSSLSGSKQPLDVEENNTKEVGGVALAASSDNEEFGETADAEVGTAENESESYPDAVENANSSEMEIDQIMSPGKSEKSKESRLMKHFKVALADFVKGVLKPSWRQGNMSKEAFKTVVKKTVDKASGAMKSHQIPKSKAKINQYIDSSERKLTKLVMGYVDKYAKG